MARGSGLLAWSKYFTGEPITLICAMLGLPASEALLPSAVPIAERPPSGVCPGAAVAPSDVAPPSEVIAGLPAGGLEGSTSGSELHAAAATINAAPTYSSAKNLVPIVLAFRFCIRTT